MAQLYQIAKNYVDAGLSVLPVRTDGSKAPAIPSWKELQQRLPTDKELQDWFDRDNPPGIAIIGGNVSGGLEILDFESGSPIQECRAALKDLGKRDLAASLTAVTTPSGGLHLFYRCDEIQGSQKLLVSGRKTVVETKSEGGYVITTGSPPECHPSGKPYQLTHGSLQEINRITPEDRSLLFDIIRSLGEPAPIRIHTGAYASVELGGSRPGDEFGRAASWESILEPHGWRFLYFRDEEVFWVRPGKKSGVSATTNYKGSDLLYVYSTNGMPFQPNESYSKFAAYALLNHNGDYSAASKELRSKGFGKSDPILIEEWKASQPVVEHAVDLEESTRAETGNQFQQGDSNSPSPFSGPTPDDWPDPEELQPPLPEVMKLDPRMFPSSMFSYLQDVSERLQCPMDFVAGSVLGILASAINRRAMIQPKCSDSSWTSPANLWIALVGRPSTMKSPAAEGPMRILSEIEREWSDEHTQKMEEYQEELMKDVIRKRAWESVAIKDAKAGKVIPDSPTLAGNSDTPIARRLIVGDASYEALHLRLSENPYGLLLYRDELSSMFASLDEEGRRAERGFLLECYTGKSQLKFDRIGRGVIDCPNACLSILGTIQPGRLRPILSGAIEQGRGDDGLSQRFLFLWPDPAQSFEYIDRTVDQEALKQLAQSIRVLAEWSPEEAPVFRLEEDAQGLFIEWYTENMRAARSEDIHPPLEAFLVKLPKPVCSIALIFELFERASIGRPLDDPPTVGYVNMARACSWGEYLISHAGRAYYHLTRHDVVAAAILGEKILKGQIGSSGEFTNRELHRKGWSLLNEPGKAMAACKELQAAGWLQHVVVAPAKAGGRPSEKYKINPKVLSRMIGNL